MASTDLISLLSSADEGRSVSLSGWIYQIRSSGKIAFVNLRDGTGFVQCIIEKKVIGDEAFEAVTGCGIESVLELQGTISKHPKRDEIEIQVESVTVLSVAKDYPLGQKEHGVEFLYDNRHLYLRSPSQRAVQRVRDEIIHATYDWMRSHHFTKIDAPIFTPTCAEDSTELYSVTHTNDAEMFLSQSGQMYIEAAIAGHRNVYDFGPVFRAEKSKTRRHLNELWMMDAEMAFCDYKKNMDIQQELIQYIVGQVLENRAQELAILERDTDTLRGALEPFERMLHADVVTLLQSMGSDIKQGEDLGADDERILMEDRITPLFVTNYPKDVKSFYMPEDPENPGTAKCSDLLAPEGYGEVIGGSERESDYEVLKKKIVDHGYDLADYQRYLDIRKYGGVQTSGFGFGLERLVMWICGLQHIRESIPFPRYHHRITP